MKSSTEPAVGCVLCWLEKDANLLLTFAPKQTVVRGEHGICAAACASTCCAAAHSAAWQGALAMSYAVSDDRTALLARRKLRNIQDDTPVPQSCMHNVSSALIRPSLNIAVRCSLCTPRNARPINKEQDSMG